MNIKILEEIKNYLEIKGIYSMDTEENEVDRREQGKTYSTNEHLRALIYSLLTNQNEWNRVAPKLPQIDNLFFDYDINMIKEWPGSYFADGIFSLSCGSIHTAAQMNALHYNIGVMEKIISKYGSMDDYVTSFPAYIIVEQISDANSSYKLKQVGPALAWEYLRNVGIDGAKPDTHLKRFMGSERMGVSRLIEATDKEIYDEVELLSKKTGYKKFVVDYLIWSYCAEGLGEVCSKHPHCDICVVRQYCNTKGGKTTLDSCKEEKEKENSTYHLKSRTPSVRQIKTDETYRDQYFDAYFDYIAERTTKERSLKGLRPYSESTIKTMATDTFYLEKHDD